MSGGEIIYSAYSVNATQSYDVKDNVNTFDIIGGVATFNIEGIPSWLSILAVYVPIFLLILGTYALIRGI